MPCCLGLLTLSSDAQDPNTGDVVSKDLWVGGLVLYSVLTYLH